jgi:hypothetical protein
MTATTKIYDRELLYLRYEKIRALRYKAIMLLTLIMGVIWVI